MADNPLQLQKFSRNDANENYGDCEADPVPGLWFQDDDDMYSDSGFVERFWLPLSIAVLLGWGSVSFVLINAFGWMVILAVAGVVVAGSVAAVALVKTGDVEPLEMPVSSQAEPEERRFRNAA